jgi:hypothetical protein
MPSVWRRLDVSKLAAAFSVIINNENAQTKFVPAYKSCFSLYCKSAHDQVSHSIKSIGLTDEGNTELHSD